MHHLTPLFQELFSQSPLPLKGVERVALQLCRLEDRGAMFEAFKEAAMVASDETKHSLEDWLQNHWNQLSRHPHVPEYDEEIMAAVSQQLNDGSIHISGVDTDAGLIFTRSTETHDH